MHTAGFLRTTDPDRGLVPAMDIETVTVEKIVDHFRGNDQTDPDMTDDQARGYLERLFADIDQHRSDLVGGIDFRKLAAQFPLPRPEDKASEPSSWPKKTVEESSC